MTIRPPTDPLHRMARALVAFGFFWPWVARLGVETWYKPSELGRILRAFPAQLFGEGDNLFLLAVINAAPFAILAAGALWRLRSTAGGSPDRIRARIWGTLAVTMTFIGLNVLVHVAVWQSVFGPAGPDAQAVVPLVVLPMFELVAMPVIYLVGWLAGRLTAGAFRA